VSDRDEDADEATHPSATDSETVADRARTLVVNGLREVVGGDRVLLDADDSRRLRQRYETATTADQRADFERALSELGDGDAVPPAVGDVVNAVIADLADAGDRLAVTHEATWQLERGSSALYAFFRTRNPEHLAGGGLPPGAIDAAERAASGESAAGAAALAALPRDATGDAASLARLEALTGLAHHWAGEDGRARSRLEAAHEAGGGRDWAILAIEQAVIHPSPAAFRSGRLAATAFLRWRATVPEGGRLDVSLNGERVDGRPGAPLCVPVDSLAKTPSLRIVARGPPRAVPSLDTYYLAVGVVDHGSEDGDRAPNVDRVRAVVGSVTDAERSERLRLE
jgi:hypothetical protein